MGYRHAAVLSAIGFLLGVLFISFNADYRVLWQPLTDKAIDDAFYYYSTFYNAPKIVQNLLHGVVAIGGIGLIAKLHKWDESAMFFDGSSLVAYMFGVLLYMTVVIPGLRTVCVPIEGETRDVQIEALRVLAAGNTLIAGCLGLVLALQGGQEWARRADSKALVEYQADQTMFATHSTAPVTEEKKTQ